MNYENRNREMLYSKLLWTLTCTVIVKLSQNAVQYTYIESLFRAKELNDSSPCVPYCNGGQGVYSAAMLACRC